MPGASRCSPNPDVAMGPQPPPVASKSGAAKVTVQAWQSPPKLVAESDDSSGYGHHHVRCGSLDSVDSSSGSSTTSSTSSHTRQLSNDGEYLPTRSTVKTPAPPPNPLQFVKVNSPLYKKAESQIKLAKEVKITKEALKESEEEWQCNLDDWKSRRRKVSEKVIQRAEEMRQIEQEEQFRQLKEQQRKIKTFSEMVENRSTKRSYNLDLYISHGDDSGVGGTPEPEEHDGILDSHQSNIRSDTSEGMTSETESIDSDAHCSERPNKEPPKVPKKPASWLARKNSSEFILQQSSSPSDMLHHSYITKDTLNSENAPSSTEPSDIEGHAADTETASSEDDAGFCGTSANVDSGLESLCDGNRPNDTAYSASDLSQDSSSGTDKVGQENETEFITSSKPPEKPRRRGQLSKEKSVHYDDIDHEKDGITVSINATNNIHEAKGFGFGLRNGKSEGIETHTESSVPDVPVREKKFDKKGASFAEKLAIFSGGSSANGGSKLSQTSKLSKEDELKRESLVLRRRTTFERSSAEKEEAKNRRSSCISPETTSKCLTMEERRHSVDFSRSPEKLQEMNGSVTSKKPLPPPVPAKPKVKPKTYHTPTPYGNFTENLGHSVPDKIAVKNKRNEDYLQELNNDIDDNYTVIYSSRASAVLSPPNVDRNGGSLDVLNNGEKSSDDSVDEADYSQPKQDVFSVDSSTENQVSRSDFDSLARKEIAELRRLSLEEVAACCTNPQSETMQNNKDEYVSSPTVDNVNCRTFEDLLPLNDAQHDDEVKDIPEAPEDTSEPLPEPEDIRYDIDSSFSNSASCHAVDVENEELLEKEQASILSFSHDPEMIDEEPEENFANNMIQDSSLVEHSFPDEIIDHEISTLSREHFVQINVHSLGMPLEKIDEDDPISGGTNSSSTDTPDTETVIDIFPSDVPPLPVDDDVDVNREYIAAQQEGDEYGDGQPYISQPTTCAEEIEEASEVAAVESEKNYLLPSDNTYCEKELDHTSHQLYEEDHELCDENELAERADQLSPLDVIDQMELRLMQELEQQALEDYSDESNDQLEEEVSRQLLYLSDDTDFIDDLDVPRNVVPPSEPPPPPPPEPEKVDSKGNPFQRANSTKRIKKEIWRRRSDFLGLDSPSGINVDDLPPPPPGLEELLKSEMELQREQRLYMEKHLSLADSDYVSAPETLNSLTDSTTFSPSKEYTSEYMMEVLDAEVFDAVPAEYSQNETWKIEECQSPVSDLGIHETGTEREAGKNIETAQQKAKNHIHSLGAAPRAKIMDSNKWITQAEKHAPLTKRMSVDPLLRDGAYTQNFWLAQEADRRVPTVETTPRTAVDRRYSMPPAYGSKPPDVTVRTWSDRESEYQQQPRPKSGAWPDSSVAQHYPSSNHSNYYSNRSSSWTESTNGLEESTNQYDVSHDCSYCGQALTEGSAMGIDALQLYFHIECFRCCLCQLQLGNGSCGTDVQVKNSQLYCPKCFALD